MTERQEPKITNCYVFGNGMVMTFDQYGQQMPDYQGHRDEVWTKIRAVYDGPIEGLVWEDVRAAMRERDAHGECVRDEK